MNLFDNFAQMVAPQPDHPLIVGPQNDQQETYQQVYDHVQTLITALKAHGVSEGKSVGLH